MVGIVIALAKIEVEDVDGVYLLDDLVVLAMPIWALMDVVVPNSICRKKSLSLVSCTSTMMILPSLVSAFTSTRLPLSSYLALNDINKWNCTLEVPIVGLEDYKIAEQWKEFFFFNGIETGVTTGIGVESYPQVLFDTNYNLRGQRLDAPQKGINIIGGKKVVVK